MKPTKEQIKEVALNYFRHRHIDEKHPQFNEAWQVMGKTYIEYAEAFIEEWEKIRSGK